MANQKNRENISDIETDFANLARLAASGSQEDTRLLLARLVRKYRQQRPELAILLDQALKVSQTRSAGNSILRRDMSAAIEPTEASLPVDGDSRLALIRVFDDREGLAPPPRAPSIGRPRHQPDALGDPGRSTRRRQDDLRPVDCQRLGPAFVGARSHRRDEQSAWQDR